MKQKTFHFTVNKLVLRKNDKMCVLFIFTNVFQLRNLPNVDSKQCMDDHNNIELNEKRIQWKCEKYLLFIFRYFGHESRITDIKF